MFTAGDDTTRVLHVSDLHLNPAAIDVMRSVITQFQVDVVVDTGDLTDFGSGPETSFVASLSSLGVPYVYARGNHDSTATQAAVAGQPDTVMLDGPEVVEVAGLRFLGQGDPRFTPASRPGTTTSATPSCSRSDGRWPARPAPPRSRPTS